MRFILLNQFYPPDVAPTGQVLHNLAKTLVMRGHQVEVFCSRRSYNGGESFKAHETIDGVLIRRIPAFGFGRLGMFGKLLDYGSFYLLLALQLLISGPKPDVVVCLTTPPYVGLLGSLTAKFRRCSHAHWVMDVYPDVMAAHGMLSRKGLLYRALATLTRIQFSGACLVLGLGEEMSKLLNTYLASIDVDRITHAVPLWGDPSLAPWPDGEPNPLRTQRGWSSEELVFMYSGNMGLGHRFSEFLAAAEKFGEDGPRWVFAGAGRRRSEIEIFAKSRSLKRIEFLPYVPRDQLRSSLCTADVHLASLDSRWEGMIVPSKVQGIFAVGKPLIYVGSEHGELAQWIAKSGGGWVVPENDLASLMKAIAQAQDPAERSRRGLAARHFAQRHFDMQTNCDTIASLLEVSATAKKSRNI